jgi:3-vinyl bacteriochlorophyllide hydratase
MENSERAIAQRRAATIWTRIHPPFAFAQLAVCIVSVGLICLFFAGQVSFKIVHVSALLKIGLMAGAMLTGSLWERAVYGYWWFAPEFFLEDLLTYVVALFQIGYLLVYYHSPDNLAANVAVLIVSYFAYVVNVTQYVLKHRVARRAMVRVAERSPRDERRGRSRR